MTDTKTNLYFHQKNAFEKKIKYEVVKMTTSGQ